MGHPGRRPAGLAWTRVRPLPGHQGGQAEGDQVDFGDVVVRLRGQPVTCVLPLDAVAKCRERCWTRDWILDLDVEKFFDSVDHDLIVKAVEANTDQKWVVLYVKRWLKAPIQMPDGRLAKRERGTPQGSAVSPVLANLLGLNQ